MPDPEYVARARLIEGNAPTFHWLRLPLPTAFWEQAGAEAARDGVSLTAWLLDAVTIRLASRLPAGERVALHRLCRWCRQERRIEARGYCKRCYQTQYRAAYLGTCSECQRRRVMRAKGLCNACYQRQYRARKVS